MASLSPETEANPTRRNDAPPPAQATLPPAAPGQGPPLEKFFRAAISQDVLEQEVKALRDSAGRWACQFDEAVNVTMQLKEQVKVLQHGHETVQLKEQVKVLQHGHETVLLNTPRIMESDGSVDLVKELARRKLEVGQLKKKVRLLQEAGLAQRTHIQRP